MEEPPMPYNHDKLRMCKITQLEWILINSGKYLQLPLNKKEIKSTWLIWRINQLKIYKLIGKDNART